MIKKTTQKYKILGATFVVLILLLLTEGFLLRHFADKQYQKLVADEEVVQTFYSGKDEIVVDIANKYAIEYQKISGDEFIFASDSDLPTPNIIPVMTRVGKSVIQDKMEISLKQLKPSILFWNNKAYISFVLPVNKNDEQLDLKKTDMYIIYKSIF